MKKIIFIALLGCCFLRCTNSEEEITYQYPSNLSFTKYEILDNVKVYTKDGEINDPIVVKKFINDGIVKKTFEDKIGTENTSNNEVVIIFESKDSISIKDFGEWRKFGISYQKDNMYAVPKDTLKFILPEASNLELLKLEANIGLTKGYFDITPLPSSAGQQDFYNIKSFIKPLFRGNPNEISIKGMGCKIKLKTGSTSFQKFMYNEGFDKNVISSLKIGDTIAVQNKKQIYQRLVN